MSKQIGTKEKKEIKLLAKQGLSQLTIANKYREDGYTTTRGKPVMSYTVSAIVNEARIKARTKRKAKGEHKTNYNRVAKAAKTEADNIPEDFLLEIVASKALSKKQKVKQLIALLSEEE